MKNKLFHNTNVVCVASIVSALRHKHCIMRKEQRRNEVIMKKKTMRVLLCLALVAVTVFITTKPALAAGNVSSAIENTWKAAQTQVKNVVNNVVFPVIDMILAILFFVKLGTAYFDYRKHGQFEFTAPAILFACLIFTLTAPLYIWTVL